MTLPFDDPPRAAGSGRRLVVEADGGSRGNPGPAAYGALVRDAETGERLREDAKYLGDTTNNVAEYSGLVSGLRMASDIDPTASVVARLDSQLVVKQMSGEWKIKQEGMRRLALEARAVFPPDQVTYQWVPRAQNSAADRLVNEALDLAARGQTWQPRPVAYAGETEDPDGSQPRESGPQMSETTTTPGSADSAPRLAYRLLTGADDTAFCERVSAALADGYQLHGNPAIAHDGTRIVVAQALVDPRVLGLTS